jgi:hypothetical protein
MHSHCDIKQRVGSLDLAPIMYAVTEKIDGPHWPVVVARRAEAWYRQFLVIVGTYPTEMIVPTKLIDEFWHHHIVDTLKYVEDCDHLFGEYLHHFPYLGVRSPEDRQDWRVGFDRTLQLFREEFGSDPVGALRGVSHDLDTSALASPGYCAGACSKVFSGTSGSMDLARPHVRGN